MAWVGDCHASRLHYLCIQISKFSLPRQHWSSEQSLTDTIKLTDPENPVGARIWGVSPAEAVIADFLLKVVNFRCNGNNGLSEPNATRTVQWADPENQTIEPKITTLS